MLGEIRGDVRFKEPLSFHTSLRIGGPADIFVIPQDLDDIRQRSGRTVMEVRRARRQPAQNRSFDFADIGTFAADHGAADVCDLKRLPRQWPGGAPKREDRQP